MLLKRYVHFRHIFHPCSRKGQKLHIPMQHTEQIDIFLRQSLDREKNKCYDVANNYKKGVNFMLNIVGYAHRDTRSLTPVVKV